MSEQNYTSSADLMTMRRRAILSCLVGNTLEFYDFIIFGFFAIYIGQTFFPSENAYVSLLSSLATFGAGFVMRPFGALIIGMYADRFGRRRALILTMGVMATATGAIGLLPGYDTIGLWAPVLLLLCRLAQGFSAGGEWASAVVFLIEFATPKRRGFFTSWSQVGIMLGTIFGSTSALAVTSLMSLEMASSWGWRIPFLVGLLIMPVGYYLRARVDETPAFQRLLAEGRAAKSPLRESLAGNKTTIARIVGICAVWACCSYVLFIYLPSFAKQVLNIDYSSVLAATTIGSVVSLLLFPLIGSLSDKVGRKPIVLAANVSLLLLTYPLFAWMKAEPSLIPLLVTSLFAGIVAAMLGGAVPALVGELISTRLRSTVVGIGYSISVVIFGGFAPFICTYLVQQLGDATAPAYFVVACAAISTLTLMNLRDRAQLSLSEI